MRFSNLHRFDPAIPQFLFAPDDNGGGGTGNVNTGDPNAGGGNNPITGGQSAADRRAEIDAAVNARIAELTGGNPNNAQAALDQLVRRAHGLEKKIEDLKTRALPDAEKASFEAFKSLNLTPDAIKAIVAEHGQMKAESAQKARISSLETAAAAAGINAELLKSLSGALDVEYLVSGEGESKVATVKTKNGDKEEVKPLLDWIDEKYPALKTVLRTQPGTGGGAASAGTVTKYGKSAPAGGGKAPSLAQQIRDEEKAKNGGGKESGEDGANRVSLREKLRGNRR